MNEDTETAAAMQKISDYLRRYEEQRGEQAEVEASLDDTVLETEIAEQWENSSIAQEMRQRLNEV